MRCSVAAVRVACYGRHANWQAGRTAFDNALAVITRQLSAMTPLSSFGTISRITGVRREFLAAGETGTRCRATFVRANPRLPPQR